MVENNAVGKFIVYNGFFLEKRLSLSLKESQV